MPSAAKHLACNSNSIDWITSAREMMSLPLCMTTKSDFLNSFIDWYAYNTIILLVDTLSPTCTRTR